MGLLDRSISDSSDDIDIRPLELGDLKRGLSESSDECHYDDANHNEKTNLFFSAVMGIKRKRVPAANQKRSSLVKMAWKNAAMKALSMEDPWKQFQLNKYQTEKAHRHRYHALKKCWVVDEVVIKMEDYSFNHGAMRECFRTKKLSNFSKNNDWSRAHNYVAKRYIDKNVDRKTYFDDVTLQMDAKLWGEEFNRHNPPKKVDIFQMAIVELITREGSPLFHVEHFIEGNYVKYNSNSGFVLSEALRMTPQALSHFTFERSGHELIVVDIQGVGDLYTDPQIHTSTGSEYGDGNLGTRGMALFFQSHICNSICRSLDLSSFDLAPSEVHDSVTELNNPIKARTVIRGTVERVVVPNELERENIQDCFRLRTFSGRERKRFDSLSSVDSLDNFDDVVIDYSEDCYSEPFENTHRPSRVRYDSTSDFGESTETQEKNWKNFDSIVRKKSRPSHILGELEHQKMIEALDNVPEDDNDIEVSVLGQIHLDLSMYHEINRFVEENETYDHEAAMFHLNYAAKCGTLAAILSMAQIHMGLPHDILPDIEFDEDERDSSKAFDFLFKGAQCGDRASMIKVAKMFDSGIGLPIYKCHDWNEAIEWYGAAIMMEKNDQSGNFDGTMDDPIYQLKARQAQLYLDGGFGLQRDPNIAGELYTEAADLASEAMKGKLASKYYILAEEAWGEVED